MSPRLLDLPGGTVQMDEAVFEQLAGRRVYLGANGYAFFSTHRTGPVLLHAFVLGGGSAVQHVDHINGDKLDNRRANLRLVSPQINQVNRKHLNKNNTSGVRGVQPYPHSAQNPWRAQITVDRRAVHLGLFPTREAAVAARRAAELTYFGELCP